jgi:hypothetical protein
MAVKIPYVVKRGNIYHFRIAIPKQLQAPRDLPTGTHRQPFGLAQIHDKFFVAGIRRSL